MQHDDGVGCDEPVPVPFPSMQLNGDAGPSEKGESSLESKTSDKSGRSNLLPSPVTKTKKNKTQSCRSAAENGLKREDTRQTSNVVDTVDRSTALLQYYSRLSHYQKTVEMAETGDSQAQLFLREFSSTIQESLERQWDALQNWDTRNENLAEDKKGKENQRAISKKVEQEEDLFWEELSQTFLVRRGQSANTEISLLGTYGADCTVHVEEISTKNSRLPSNHVPVVNEVLPSNVVSQTPSEMEDEDDTVLQEFIQRYKELKKKAREPAKRKNGVRFLDSMKTLLKEDDETLTTAATTTTASSFFEAVDIFVDDLARSVRDVATCSTCEPENDATHTVKTTRFVDRSQTKNLRRNG
jgi:uncharacterized protein (DUF305 family)/molybdopterin converting factor small subunit